MGSPAWTADERFATPLARERHKPELDQLVSQWTRERNGMQIMEALQAAGVAAAPIQDVEDQLGYNPQFEARGLFVTLDEPEMGPIVTEAPPVKASDTPPLIYRAAPLIGEHTASVLRDILQLTDAEIAELTEHEVLT